MNDAATGVSRGSEIRLAIVDPRPLIAEALAAVIGARDGFSVTLTAQDGVGLVANQPDVVLVGTVGDTRRTLRVANSLRAALPQVGVVIVADELEPELVNWVLEGAPSGLLLTDAHADEIAGCVEQVVLGHTVLPSGWQRAGQRSSSDPLGTLSERQLEVLRLLADGLSYDEIATRLYISVNTVRFHVRSIFLRLGVRNRMAAARLLSEATRA